MILKKHVQQEREQQKANQNVAETTTYESCTEATGREYLFREVCGKVAFPTGEDGIMVPQLAELVGAKMNTVYSWEHGTRSPNIEDLPIIAEALELKERPMSYTAQICPSRLKIPG